MSLADPTGTQLDGTSLTLTAIGVSRPNSLYAFQPAGSLTRVGEGLLLVSIAGEFGLNAWESLGGGLSASDLL